MSKYFIPMIAPEQPEALDDIQIGDFVTVRLMPTNEARQMGFTETELIRVRIEEMDGPRGDPSPMFFTGTVDSIPYSFPGVLFRGDPVSFDFRQIFTVTKGY